MPQAVGDLIVKQFGPFGWDLILNGYLDTAYGTVEVVLPVVVQVLGCYSNAGATVRANYLSLKARSDDAHAFS